MKGFVLSAISILFLLALYIPLGEDVEFENDPDGMIMIPMDVTFSVLMETQATIHSFDEALALILIQEIYLCTCSVQVRVLKLKNLFIKIAVAFVLVSLPPVITLVIMSQKSVEIESVGGSSAATTHPVATVIGIVLAVAVLYYSSRVIWSLVKSANFRQSASSDAGPRNQNSFVIFVVSAIVLVRVTRLSIHIARVAITTLLFKRLFDQRRRSLGSSGDNLDHRVDSAPIEFLYIGNIASGLLECICVLAPRIVKKVAAVFDRQPDHR